MNNIQINNIIEFMIHFIHGKQKTRLNLV